MFQSAIIPFVMILFGTVSAFSGQQLFPEILNAINNLFFTGTHISTDVVIENVYVLIAT